MRESQAFWLFAITTGAGVVCWIVSWMLTPIMLRAFFSAASIGLAVLAVRLLWMRGKRGQSRRLQMPDEELREQLVQAISLHRHDWMNDIQLLMGYVQLKKHDKLKEFVEILRNRATQESSWFRWGIPELILHIYMFNARSRHVQITVESDEDVQLHKLSLDAAYVASRIMDMADLFERIAVSGHLDNRLNLAVYTEDEELCAVYEYVGLYELDVLREQAGLYLGQEDFRRGTSLQLQEHEDWVTATLRFPMLGEVLRTAL